MKALPSRTRSDLERLARLGSYMTRHAPGRTALALVYLLLGSLTEGLTILLLIPVLQLLGPEGNTVALPVLSRALPWLFPEPPRLDLVAVLVLLVALVAAQALFNRFRSIYMTELLYDVVTYVRVTLFESIGRARWKFVASTRGSDFQHALTADVERIHSACMYLLMLVQDAVLLAAYLVLSLFISPAMTGFAFVTGAAMLVALHPIRRRSSVFGERLTEGNREQHRVISEFLAGLKLAKSHNSEERYLASLTGMLVDMRSEVGRYMRLSSMSNVLFQVSSAVALSVFVYVGLRVFALPLAELVVLVFLFSRVAPRFSAIQQDVQQLLVSFSAFDATQRLLAECERERDEQGEPGSPVPLLTGSVTLEQVSFSYQSRPGAILDGVSFTIPAGRITAIIGASGSGKSTAADLVMGLLEPDSGTVSVDGVALRHASRRSWRDQTAYVPQEVFLLHDTIAANLAFGRPEASPDEMWAALRSAYAEDFVRRLPLGLDTVVGDRGLRLSGGERQRIALARALLRRPRLLILDEATSALDWESQSLIARSIEELRGSMTIVTIAHRLSMIRFADWVIAFEGGKVVEEGPFATLAGQAGSQLARLVSGEAEPGREPGAEMASASLQAAPAAAGSASTVPVARP